LLIEWDNLRKIVWKDNCVISPGKFITTIQKVAKLKDVDIFTGFAQNDVSEFLLFIIDCFHNTLSRQVKMSINGTPENEKDKIVKELNQLMDKLNGSKIGDNSIVSNFKGGMEVFVRYDLDKFARKKIRIK